MISSAEQLVDAAAADPRIASLVERGDWYLIGSRVTATADELSDWDTVLILPDDNAADEESENADEAPGDPSRAVLDQAFGVVRPPMPRPPSLADHVRWRAVAAVDIEVFDRDARERRECDGLASWAFLLRHAVPLRPPTGFGEEYRRRVAEHFAARREELSQQAYRGFRLSRNQAAASLARADAATQALTTAQCVAHAARFRLLALGEPHPSDKWLLDALDRRGDCGELVAAMRVALDFALGPDARFDALWRLWRLVDGHALEAAMDPALMAGSPFVA